MAAYRQGVQQLAIKRHGLWASDSFWDYIIMATYVQQSSLAQALVRCITAT